LPRSRRNLIRDFRNSRRMPGVDRIYVPGERSFETRAKRTHDGIPTRRH
jgi:L-2-hydroxycarboxylate dehydrogenase (NAD+)